MRIRFFSYFYPPCIGGGEVILQHQAEELARRGHEVHVHTTPFRNIQCTEQGPTGSTEEGGVFVHRSSSFLLPFHNPLEKDAVTPHFLVDVAKPADLIVAVGYPSLHLDWILARRRLRPVPVVAQNYITAEFLREILGGAGGMNKKIRALFWKAKMRRQLARPELLLADSPGAAAALRQELGLKNVRTHIGMAVDPAEFDAVTPQQMAEARRQIGLNEASFILAPSRISRQKGADLLIEAIAPEPGLRLAVVGPVNEPDYYAGLQALAKPLGNRVVFGQLPRPLFVALIKAASVVVLPSRGETVGGVVFEGMYAGVPVVVSDAVEAAAQDYLRGDVGILFPSENVEALRRALKEALCSPPERIAAARRLVQEHYTWKSSVDRLEKLFAEAQEGFAAAAR